MQGSRWMRGGVVWWKGARCAALLRGGGGRRAARSGQDTSAGTVVMGGGCGGGGDGGALWMPGERQRQQWPRWVGGLGAGSRDQSRMPGWAGGRGLDAGGLGVSKSAGRWILIDDRLARWLSRSVSGGMSWLVKPKGLGVPIELPPGNRGREFPEMGRR
ncbi:hypothetical protein DFH27DRAFT_197445 [Peziza echinospora]|nr:hypothetical protein DFH27DRAFT_197445 [Peziza echinospora]